MGKHKNKILSAAIWGILVVVFNAVTFLIAGEKSPLFWTGYGFAMFAFVMQLCATFMACGKDMSLHTAIVGIPLFVTAWAYLAIQLLLSIVFMLIGGSNSAFTWILELLLTAAFLILLILSVMVKDHSLDIEKNVQSKRFFLGALQTDVQAMADRASDTALKKALNNLFETIRYSDPMSHASLASVENRISGMVAMLGEQTETNDTALAQETIQKIELAFAERNRKCKLLK